MMLDKGWVVILLVLFSSGIMFVAWNVARWAKNVPVLVVSNPQPSGDQVQHPMDTESVAPATPETIAREESTRAGVASPNQAAAMTLPVDLTVLTGDGEDWRRITNAKLRIRSRKVDGVCTSLPGWKGVPKPRDG